ncbi:MAG: helix-turn-helix transcriptional regulator [Microbacteriaceae bacterium]|nr:helix-turn-helix transcriptional regulator [Microbacteriaceae bacterium]
MPWCLRHIRSRFFTLQLASIARALGRRITFLSTANLALPHKVVVSISNSRYDRPFSPINARTSTAYTEVAPIAYDCVKIIVVRAGGALLFSEFGIRHVNVGDVVVLAANTLCSAEPEDWVTTTTLYLHGDYLVDQVFWQFAAQFVDRFDAHRFLESYYVEPARVIRIGEDRLSLLMPWLDELAALSLDGFPPQQFYRAQSLLFAVLDVIFPCLTGTGPRSPATKRSTVPWPRGFVPLRAEARHLANLLSGDLARRWSLSELANAVHLSPSQLRRVFVNAYGRSPIAYLTMLRAKRMADLLRTTDTPIAIIAATVGWGDPDFAARQFRRSIGVTRSQYRMMIRRRGN